MSDIIAVAGATGNVGSKLADALLSRGRRVRAIGRDRAKLKNLEQRGAETAVGDLADPSFTARAFAQAKAVFALIPPNFGAPDLRSYQDQVSEGLARGIRDAGVTHVVNLSSAGAQHPKGTGPIAGLHAAEQRLNRLADVNVVHLRAAFFMENHLMSLGMIKSTGVYVGALEPDLAVAMIAARDIAAVAAELLGDRSFTGTSVREVLGPRDYTMTEVTRILGDTIGRKDASYVRASYEDTEKALLGIGDLR